MKKIIVLISIAAALCACRNFVELDLPGDQLTKDLIFKDAALAKAAMAGVYRSLDDRGFLSGATLGGGMYLGAYADELVSYQVSTSDLSQLHLLTVNPQSLVVQTLWANTYSQLYAVNAVLEGLRRSETVDAGVKNQLTGEALFVRALLMLYLTETYGAVPYVTETDYVANTHIAKESREVILQKVEQDLQLAEPLLPAEAPKGQRTRPTKMAVYALQARTALYMKDWAKALNSAEKVLSRPAYAMESSLNGVFLKESSSTVWHFQPRNAQAKTSEGSAYIVLAPPPKVVALVPAFVQSFEPGDARRSAWVAQIQGGGQTYYYPYKYKKSGPTATSTEFSVILRVEELVLISAEAHAQLDRPVEALAALNAVRARAGLPAIQSSDKNVILNAILEERRHELFTEFGHRFSDLKRAGRLDAEMVKTKPQWKPHYRLLPLPESELLLNTNLLPQNDGY